MKSYSRGEVVLVRYPFSDLSGSKVRPAVIVNAPHTSQDFCSSTNQQDKVAATGRIPIERLAQRGAERGNGSKAKRLYSSSESDRTKRWAIVRFGS